MAFNLQNINEKYKVNMQKLFEMMIEKKASDLHIIAGVSPGFRIDGEIMPSEDLPKITPGNVEWLLSEITKPEQREKFDEEWELDFSYAIPKLARFRGNVMRQRGSIAMVFRAVPFEMPEFDKLGLIPSIKDMCYLNRGLVLVTGPTGSGKSTTLASMIDIINSTRRTNIVTIEDPIEYLHRHKKSNIRQRELGTDTKSFHEALRRVLRHDPDVILIGEMRDLESISIALTAAETGHLVFSTLHTQTAPLTINRIVDVFGDEKREQIRQQLANTLRGIISQQLIPKKDEGRVVAVEYMLNTSAVKTLIREGKEHQLYNVIQTGQKFGMQTMDTALCNLYKEGKVSKESVYEHCIDKPEIERSIGSGAVAKLPGW